MRLIDADTVVTIQVYDDMTEEWDMKRMTIAEAIEEWSDEGCPPTVDSVKHGHWDNKIIEFDVPHTVARCSNCKGKIWVYAENYEVKYPYCPLCGAKMTGESDE